MNLLIDIGNSSIKLAKSAGTDLCEEVIQSQISTDFLSIYLSTGLKVERAIVADSGKVPDFLKAFLEEKQIQLHVISPQWKLPFSIHYETPETLGKDRLANVAGALALYPGKNCLIIDAGTAVTYEYLIEGNYLGGAISPGLKTRFKALADQTDKLPLLEASDDFIFPGNSTRNSILSGVILGLVHELNGHIDSFLSQYPNGSILLSGGDSKFLAKRINSHIFAHPNLVMIGLNHLLNSNFRSN